MAGQNLPIELEARLLTRAADAQAKALADRTQDRFSKINIGFNGGSFKAGSAALGKISQDADQFEKSMAAANARVLAFGTAVGVIEGMRRAFLALVKTTTDVELALTKISVVAEKDLQKAGISIERVGKQIFDVAKQTGQSWQTAADTMLEFSRQGVKPAEALKRTRDALILSRISGIDYKEAVEGLTSTLNAFSKTGIDSTAVINKLVAVDNNAAASATDLIQGLQRMASTAQLTGQSIDDAVASIATLQEITFRGGPQIGNSLKSLAIRIYDPENIKYIESLGDGMTKIRDDSLNLLSAVEIIGNLGETIKKLPKEEQINVIKNIFGQYQTNAAASLIQGMEDVNNQLSIFNKNKQLSQNAGNDALSANAKLSEILASKFNTLNVQIGELLNSFGKLGVADPLSGFLDSVSWIVDNLKGAAESTDTLAQGFQFVTKVLGGAIFSKAGLAAIAFIIGKIAGDFVAFGLEAGRSFLGLNRAARDQEAIQQSIAAYIQQSGQNLNVLLNSEQARLNLTKQIAAAWNQSVLSAQQMAAVTKQIAVPIFNSGLRASPTGPSRRAADGFVPLVNAEMNDVKRGVGGASPNSKIVVMPNFPFGGGKRGMMVANSSETVVDYGGGKFGTMNPDMMAGRAAGGFLKGQKPQTVSGKFTSVGNLESGLESLAQLLVGLGKTSSEITNAATNFAKSFNLNEKSLSLVVSATEKYAVSLKQTAVRLEQEAIAESRRIALGKADQIIRSAPEKRAAFLDTPILPTASGKFIERPSPKAIERALKESSEILTKEIADAAYQEIYNGILRKRQEILEYVKKNPPNPLALSLSRTSLPGRDLSGNPTFAYLNQPIRNPLSPQSADPLTRAQEIGRLRELERIKNQPRGLSSAPSIIATQEDAAFRQRIRESTLRSNSLAAFGASQRIAAEKEFAQSKAPKDFDPEAFKKFAAKAFLAAAAAEGLASSFMGASDTLDGYLKAGNTLVAGGSAIGTFEQLKELDFSSIGEGFEKSRAGKFGGKFVSVALGGVRAFASALPIIGQIGIGLATLSSIIEDVTGKSGLQRLKEAFGGLTEEAERSAQAFKENAESMFDASGNPIGKSGLEVRQGFSARLEAAKREREARKLGIDVTGKTQQQLAAETFGKRLDSLIGGSKTGAKTVRQRFANSSIAGPSAAPSIIFETIDETLGNINSSIPEIIKDNLQILANQTEDGLRELLASKGVAKIDGQDLKDAGLEKLQEETINLFLQIIQRNLESVKKAAEVGRAGELIGNLGLIFTNLPAKTSSRSFSGSIAEKPEDVKKLLEFQQEIIGLTIDGSISGLESQIKLLDIAGQDQLLSAKSREIIARKQQQLQEKIVDEALSKNAINFITQSEILKNSGLSEPEQKQELAKLQISFENQKRAAEESKKAILEEGNARRKAANDLEKLSQSIGSVQTALNAIAIDRSVIQGNITRLQAKGRDPTLGILSQENIQRQIANQQRLDLEKSKEELFKSLDIREKEIRSTTPSDKLKQALDDLATERTRELEAINANIDALEIETSQIGSIKSARQELEDSLLEFSRSFGRDRAQNQFNLLQSTDPQSRISGLISEQVFNQSGNKTGSELVSFISDQNALLLEQSKIRTAANASEKLELETQYELTKQILEIKKQGLSPLEEQLKIEQAINANLKDRQTFGFGVRQASAEAQTRMQNFSSDFGKTAFDGFRDGLSDAIKAAVSQTDNLKSALLDVALAFANKLRDKAIDNLADVISNSLFSGGQSKSSGGGVVSGIVSAIGGFFGGGVQKRATGGMITGGTGTKDDVPTLLMGGEYVVPKSIVRQYGKGFFDRLRDGSIGKMAQGGYFAPGIRGQGTISGKENLLDFATQTATSGKGDLISSLSANAGLVSLEPESLRLTNFARFGDSPLVAATQDAKDQAFQLYLGQLEDEKAYAEYQAQLKKAKKEKKKQLWTSLAIAAVGAGLNYYGFGQQTASKSKETDRPNPGGPPPTTSTARTHSPHRPTPNTRTPPPASRSTSSLALPQLTAPNGAEGASILLPPVTYGRNSGGYSMGNGDTIPTMLSQDEFVLNKSATRKIGDKNLYALNNGAMPSGDNGSSAVVVAKLDELIEKTIGASNVTVNVTMNGGEEKSSNQNSDGQGDQNPRMLVQRIKEVVIGVIRDEQRPGGSLTKTR